MRLEIFVERSRERNGGQQPAKRAHMRALVKLKDNHTQEFEELLAIEVMRERTDP